jgi:hypothetical protein
MVTDKEINSLVLIVRRAPLHNMEEAETVAKLIDKIIGVLRAVQRPPTLRVVDDIPEDSSEGNSG